MYHALDQASKTSLEGWKQGIVEEARGIVEPSKTSLEGWKQRYRKDMQEDD